MTDTATEPTAMRDSQIPLGAHIITPRRWYTHHGIYVGYGEVVHYEGLSSSLRRGPIAKVSIEAFANGRPVCMRDEADARYAGLDVVARALSRLGEDAYDVLRNNCEHFCTWCLVGAARSPQVERLLSSPRAVDAIARLLVALVGGWSAARHLLPGIN